jgi:beta-xylosidase
MMRAHGPTAGLIAAAAALAALPGEAQVWRSDQGDGTYRNPILYADYPDPDIIRVGGDFYFVTTTFVNVPGVTILHSQDLVNWGIASHVVRRLDGLDAYDLEGGGAYRRGFYAASLRHHRGTFYLAVTPVGQKTRIYRARDIEGPWTYRELDREAFDPALFIEEDGRAYLATAYHGDGTITLLHLDADLSRITGAHRIHHIEGAEGSKIVRRGEYYYLFNAIPPRLALTVSRSRSLFGPWETRAQIDDRTGGHQGAIVDLPDGRDYGFVMVDAGAIGRTTNLSPIVWEDGWPVWGTPDRPGRVPDRAPKPIAGFAFAEPETSDDFSRPQLGLQWQWNHNPDDARWSLTERPGFLRLRPTIASEFRLARNTLIQKAQGPASRGEVRLDIAAIRPGDHCGFGTLGQFSAHIAVGREPSGRPTLSMQVGEDRESGPQVEMRVRSHPIAGDGLWLRADLDFRRDEGRLDYSLDGRRWTNLGGTFPLAFAWRTGTFQGEQFALFCYGGEPSGGYIDVDHFELRPLGD